MALLIITDPPYDPWVNLFSELAPGLEVHTWPCDINPEDVHFVMAWEPSPGTLGRFPNLRAVFSVGAGASGILRDGSLPMYIPVIRTIGHDAPDLMAEFVTTACLMLHRRIPHLLEQAARQQWQTNFEQGLVKDTSIGILGLGTLGEASARRLLDVGFSVRGWSRSGKPIDGVQVLTGADGLTKLARYSNILVCLLPLTDDTRTIIDARLLSLLPPKSGIVNVGRGEHIDETALLHALRSGLLSGAIIDVCSDEPPTAGHPFWSEPLLLMTGHNAAVSSRRARVARIVENIRLIECGKRPANMIDKATGY